MSYTAVHEPARSRDFPDGVSMQPREYSFADLHAIPQHWNMDNPVLTHFENAFSIMIPPGERFFIDSVRHYEDRVTDDEGRELIRAFVQQEGLHGQAHDAFNASLAGSASTFRSSSGMRPGRSATSDGCCHGGSSWASPCSPST